MTGTRPYGVLGRKLGHSYTPWIYRELAGLDYRKFEKEPDELEAFLNSEEWEGINVTIPYKREVVKYLDELSPSAVRLGNVNTITRLEDGRLRGDNTDYYGFKVLVESMGIDLQGKDALVFGGDGGAGSTCMKVLEDMGCHAYAVTRDGEITYKDLSKWSHAPLIVNCTPVGMYPNCPASVCSLDDLGSLEAVIDIVYNPARTGLMLQAERRGIPTSGGLLMLVAQAAQAVERYTGMKVELERMREVTDTLSKTMQNIALIGMPGCGKTSTGRELARLMDRTHIDIDALIEKQTGTTCSQYIIEQGEDAFRSLETEMLARAASGSGTVISCGGGVVERIENMDLLRQNSIVIMLDRDVCELARENRPLSMKYGVSVLAERRLPLYRNWADLIVRSHDTAESTAAEINRQLAGGK